jgi:hypothetical protein
MCAWSDVRFRTARETQTAVFFGWKVTRRRLLKLSIVNTALCLTMLTFAPGHAQERPLPKEKPAETPSAISRGVGEKRGAGEKPEPLTEKEQAELARRAEEPGKDVAGGALSNLHLTYIVIALGAAILVLVLK